MTSEEKLQKAADKYTERITCFGSKHTYSAWLLGAKSEEAAQYHKEKNKWYTEEEVKELCMLALKEDFDTTNPNNWWFENKKK